MSFQDKNLAEFNAELASKAPVPGGGGASALVGAVGTALGGMVASLTIGKKKFIPVEEELKELQAKCLRIQSDLLTLIDKDAEGFAPLAAAYSLPAETEEQKARKAAVLEEEGVKACDVPLQIMEKCCEAIDAIAVFAEKGSRLAVSDAGVGALFCKAALEGASLNVFINTKSLKDRSAAARLDARANDMLKEYGGKAEQIYLAVAASLKVEE
ncbi:MAG: cyclodeaminase/cyclohydrolase family protein [Oscillospiraceae bacterium]|nr:cyclodeaminase/cyclohydrolase family protein [Oscillospiraceae bacterium]